LALEKQEDVNNSLRDNAYKINKSRFSGFFFRWFL